MVSQREKETATRRSSLRVNLKDTSGEHLFSGWFLVGAKGEWQA